VNKGFANQLDVGPPSSAAELRSIVTLLQSFSLEFIPALLQVNFIMEMGLKVCSTQNFELCTGQ